MTSVETRQEQARRLADKHSVSLSLLGRFERLEAENRRLRTALEEADQALNSGDRVYALVAASEIISAALKGAM